MRYLLYIAISLGADYNGQMSVFKDQVGKLEIIIMTSIAHMVFFGMYFAASNPNWFAGVYTVEDGFLEMQQAIYLLLVSILCLWRFFKLKDSKSKLFKFSLLAFAALFFFGFGEEIAWGQRIFDLGSPEFFQQYNTQNDITLHNLKFGDFKINKVIFGLIAGIISGVYVLILPVLYRTIGFVQYIIDDFAVPVPKLIHTFFFLAMYILFLTIDHGKKGEVIELVSCAMFFVIFLSPYNIKTFQR